jgi:hypothetical protein
VHGCASVQVKDGKGANEMFTPSSSGNVKPLYHRTAMKVEGGWQTVEVQRSCVPLPWPLV